MDNGAGQKAGAERSVELANCLVLSVLDLVLGVHGTEGRIEEQRDRLLLREVEHVADRTGRGIEGALADTLAIQPIVLDKLRDRGLRDQQMADIVLLGEG